SPLPLDAVQGGYLVVYGVKTVTPLLTPEQARQRGHVTHSGTSTATRPAVRRDTEGSRDPSLCGRAIEWKDGVGLFGRGTAGHGPESRRWWGNGRVRHRRHQFLPAQSDRTHGYATRSGRSTTY